MVPSTKMEDCTKMLKKAKYNNEKKEGVMYSTSYVMSFAGLYFRLLVLSHLTCWSICFHDRPVDCLISAFVAEGDKHSPSAVLVHAPAAQFPLK